MFNPFLDQTPLLGYFANSADPVQMPQNVASDKGLHSLLKGISMQNMVKIKIFMRNP